MKKSLYDLKFHRGFTIIELTVVIVIIALLATLGTIGFNTLQTGARDKSLSNDLEGVKSEVTRYSVRNGGLYGAAVQWYSGDAANPNINFTPTNGNTIDVVADTSRYCIRIYNPGSSENKTLSTAKIYESTAGACTALSASAAAIVGSGGSVALGWKMLALGKFTNCGVTTDDGAYCWGQNNYKQIGNNITTTASVPTAVSTTSGDLVGKTVKYMSAGEFHSCALDSDGYPYCWGRGFENRLGNGTATDFGVPKAVSVAGVLAGKTLKVVKTGDNFSCAIASDDNAYCWGQGTSGQRGGGVSTSSTVPTEVLRTGVLSGKTIKSLTNGNSFVCAIASDDKGYCWGANANGQLGNGTTTTSNQAVAVDMAVALAGKTLKSISNSGGSNHVCAIASDDKGYCWGSGSSGQLGNGAFTSSATRPTAVDTTGLLAGKTLKTITAGGSHGCTLTSEDKVYCWGANTYGQLGDNSVVAYSYPAVEVDLSELPAGKVPKALYAGQDTNCLIATDNQAYCWGRNANYSQLGIGTSTDMRKPTLVITPAP